jgi:hypothetical protein
MSLARVSAQRMTRRSKGSSTSQYSDSLIVGIAPALTLHALVADTFMRMRRCVSRLLESVV